MIFRLWKDVTKHLKDKNVEKATEYKRFLEQRQRDEAKERKEHGLKWQTKVWIAKYFIYTSTASCQNLITRFSPKVILLLYLLVKLTLHNVSKLYTNQSIY